MTATAAPIHDPLTIPLRKHLDCGHERTDANASRLGESLHCTHCRTLVPVIAIELPRGVRLSAINRARLVDAGYTDDALDHLVAEEARRARRR